MKQRLSLLILLSMTLILTQCTGGKLKVKPIKNGAVISTPQQNLKVQFYADNIVRVVKWLPEGTDKKLSLSVIMDSLPDVKVTILENDGDVILSSGKLKVQVDNSTGNLKYSDTQGASLLAEAGTSFEPVVYSGDSSYSVLQKFNLTPDEGIYGLGQHQYGYMNYRGKTVKLVQSNTDAVNPFLVSTNGYGILWDLTTRYVMKNERGTPEEAE